MVKAWMFDYDGDMIVNYFDNEEEMTSFIIGHGLELFKTESISAEQAYKETVK